MLFVDTMFSLWFGLLPLMAQGGLPVRSDRTPPATTRPSQPTQARVPTTPALSRPAPPKSGDSESGKPTDTDILDRLPYQPDADVQVFSLPNGLLTWCKGRSNWSVIEIRMAIAAGTAHDPKGLYGRSRFLAYMLDKRLNQPQNPARSLFPPGALQYRVILGKDWVEIRLKTTANELPTALAHLSQTLATFVQMPIEKLHRDELSKSTGSFPPSMLSEQIESYMFGGQARGALLRGKKQTFQTIQPFALRSAHEKLYTANRIRLLLVGNVDCQKLPSLLQNTMNPLNKGKEEDLFVKSLVNNSGNAHSLMNAQEVLLLYQLPPLHRRSYVPLYVLKEIISKELQHQTRQQWGVSLLSQTYIQRFAYGGYLMVMLPASSLDRTHSQKMLKQTLGRLQMKQYLPALEQRVKLYLRETMFEMQQLQESTQGSIQLLWPQMLLPVQSNQKELKAPAQILPTLEAINPVIVRELALSFMLQDISMFRSLRPFSMQRVFMFIGTIILIWFLLDVILRRSRRPEE